MRWCRRNPWLAGANITAAVLTTVLAIGSTIAAWTFRDQRNTIRHALLQVRQSADQERAARIKARATLFESLLDQARARRYSRRAGQRFESLSALARAAAIARDLKLPTERLDMVRDQAIASLALPDLRPEPGGRQIRRPAGVLALAFDRTMTHYAFRFRDGTIQVHRIADLQEVARFHARGDREAVVFLFSPNGRYLATNHYPDYGVTVWDVERGSVAIDDPARSSWAAAKFSPDSRRIAVAHTEGEVVIYDLATGQPGRPWRVPGLKFLAFSPDGSRIAATENSAPAPHCRIVDAQTGRIIRSIPLRSMATVAWSPDGTTLATPGEDCKIHLWDTASGVRRATLEGHTNGGLSAGFDPSGTLLASNGWDGRPRLWDPILGRPWLSEPGASVIDGHFSHDGRIVLCLDDQLTTYEVEPRSSIGLWLTIPVRSWVMRACGSTGMAGCWPWARAGAWCSGTLPAARNSPFCRSAEPRTCSLKLRATCSPAGRLAYSGGRSGSIPTAVSFASVRPAHCRCGGDPRRSRKTGRVGSWPWPESTRSMSKRPSARSQCGRSMTSGQWPSVRTRNSW